MCFLKQIFFSVFLAFRTPYPKGHLFRSKMCKYLFKENRFLHLWASIRQSDSMLIIKRGYLPKLYILWPCVKAWPYCSYCSKWNHRHAVLQIQTNSLQSYNKQGNIYHHCSFITPPWVWVLILGRGHIGLIEKVYGF